MIRRLSPPVVLAAGLAWLALEFVVLGPYSVLPTGDNGDIFLPQFLSLAADGAPAWDRFSLMGSDAITEGANTTVNLTLYSLLPGWAAYQLQVIAAILAAGLGVFDLARRALGLNPWAAIFAGLAFATAHPFGMLVAGAAAWTPALIALADRLVAARFSWWRLALVALAVAWMSETAYLSRLIPFPSAVVAAWFVFVRRPARWWGWGVVAAVMAAPLLFRYDEIRAFAAMAPLSHVDLVRWQLTLRDALGNLAGGAFLTTNGATLAATCLAAAGLALGGLRRPGSVGVFTLVCLALVAPGTLTWVQLLLSERLPNLQSYNFIRIELIGAVALPLAAAIGIHRMLEQPAGWRRQSAPWLIGLAGLTLLAVSVERKAQSARDWVTQGSFVQNFQSPVLRDLAARIAAAGVPIRAETFQIYPTYLHAYGIETLGAYQPLFLRRSYDFFAKLVEPWARALPVDHGMWNDRSKALAENGGPVYRADRVMLNDPGHQADWALAGMLDLDLLSLANVGYLVSRDRLDGPGLELIHQPAMAWSDMSVRDKLAASLRANFTGRDHLFVYRNSRAVPRFFAVETARVESDGPSVLAALAEADLERLRSTVFLALADSRGLVTDGERFEPADITVESLTADEISLVVEAKGRAFIVASNAYSPFWQVSIDGHSGALLAADHAFWGVPVPAGRHRLLFTYRRPGT